MGYENSKKGVKMNEILRRFTQLFLVAVLLLGLGCQKAAIDEGVKPMSDLPPDVAMRDTVLETHGHQRHDPYYWLNQRENPEVIAYLEAENHYLEKQLAPVADLKQSLYDEMVARLDPTDESVPFFENGYFYYSKYREGDEYPVYLRKKGTLEAEAEMLLDLNELAKGYGYYHAAGLRVSPNNQLLAFGEDTLSRRIYTVRFLNLETGDYLPDQIPNSTGSIAWANDNRTVYYTTKDSTLRPHQVWRYVLGDPESHKLVWHEADPTYTTFAYRSKSDKMIFIASNSTLTSEYRFLNADKPDGKFQIVHPRERGIEYSVQHYQDDFYILTNWEAVNFRLMKTAVSTPHKENWQDVVAHRPESMIEGFDIFRDYLVVHERNRGLLNLRIIPWDGSEPHSIAYKDAAYSVYLDYNPEFDTEILRYDYMSLTTPMTIFDYNMRTREQKEMKKTRVLGDFDEENYISERIMIPARDGKEIPVSIVYHKDTPRDKPAPLLLYGYGSYGSTMDPYFSSNRLSLLNRGFIFALAHIRGSSMMGRPWYEDGKLLHKKNTFTDFIDVGKGLISRKYTASDILYGMGGSAGGLLIGAAINMEPTLFRAVVAQVPFVDVVTTMLDETIPLTTGEFDEWGNPKEKVYYDYMLSYSPYDNVKAVSYPAMLVTTGLHDSQVQYWEPAKWVAKLRDLKTNQNPLLLYTNMEAGHGGASGRYQSIWETALEYSFLLWIHGQK
jgi:oligopeptidase B